jgi:hypothetical protein
MTAGPLTSLPTVRGHPFDSSPSIEPSKERNIECRWPTGLIGPKLIPIHLFPDPISGS